MKLIEILCDVLEDRFENTTMLFVYFLFKERLLIFKPVCFMMLICFVTQ